MIRSLRENQGSNTLLVSPQQQQLQRPLQNIGELDDSSDFDRSTGTTPFTSHESSPWHASGSIRQQKTTSQPKDGDDDDIIMMGTLSSSAGGVKDEDHDYMNQDAIDDELSEDDMNSEDDDDDELRNCHVGGTRKFIVAQKDDRKGSIDMILSLPLLGGGNKPDVDYMNQEAIDDIEVEEGKENQTTKKSLSSDYMNQAAIDDASAELDLLPTKGAAEDDDAADWSAIEYMNQEVIDMVHQEIEKGKTLGDGYMNQDAIDAVFSGTGSQGHFYDTEDDLTEDDMEDMVDADGRMKIHSLKEPLQIRGTSPIKARTLEKTNTNLDYENQDVVEEVLEGDIIPMVIAPSKCDMAVDIDVSSHMAVNIDVSSQSSWTESADVAQPPSSGLKTQAESSSSGGGSQVMVSHDESWNESSEATRASFCTADSTSSSLDYSCPRPSTAEGGVARKGGVNELKARDEERSQSLKAPILTTKARSNTDAHAITERPPPLSLVSQHSNSSSLNSSQSTPTTSDTVDFAGQSRFGRDYIPVRSTTPKCL